MCVCECLFTQVYPTLILGTAHNSEGPQVRRFSIPKVLNYEGSQIRRVSSPKINTMIICVHLTQLSLLCDTSPYRLHVCV